MAVIEMRPRCLSHETETLTIFLETRPIWDVSTSRDRLETETSRPRPQNPGSLSYMCLEFSVLLDCKLPRPYLWHCYVYLTLFIYYDQNSSGDEIANVNFFTTISHTYFKIPKKENLLRLTNYTIARQVLRVKSWIYESATEFPPCGYRIFIPWASRKRLLLDIVIVNFKVGCTNVTDDRRMGDSI